MSEEKVPASELSQALQNCSLFAGLREDQLQKIAVQTDRLHASRGQLVIVHGDPTTDMYFLLSGSVIGQIIAENGREILFTEIAQNGYFGELAALDNRARSITISAGADCVFAKLSKERFLKILHEFPEVGVNLARDLVGQLRNMNERVFGLIAHDVETRVRVRVMQLAQAQEQLVEGGVIRNTPTHEAMAGYVGSNREAVSRAIAKLNKAGVIESERKKIVIRDLRQLLAMDR